MSQDRYFQKFPIINYKNVNAVDITKRIVFLNNVLKNPYLFYPYEIDSHERPDQFSYRYYEDQYKSWAVYMSNEIIDPYYEWYLDDTTFNAFINKKYGNVDLASLKIKRYECNWENDEPISVSRYNSLLPTVKRYWEPDYQGSNKIIQYKRKQIDQIHNTNKIVQFVVSDASNFIIDEICILTNTNGTQCYGQILSVINNIIYLQHISGNYSNNINIVGKESNTNASITSSMLIKNNLLAEEEIYWSPISYYQYEINKNAFNKTIKVLDKSYAKQIADNLESVLK
jgi:hypothetical protein